MHSRRYETPRSPSVRAHALVPRRRENAGYGLHAGLPGDSGWLAALSGAYPSSSVLSQSLQFLQVAMSLQVHPESLRGRRRATDFMVRRSCQPCTSISRIENTPYALKDRVIRTERGSARIGRPPSFDAPLAGGLVTGSGSRRGNGGRRRLPGSGRGRVGPRRCAGGRRAGRSRCGRWRQRPETR